MDFSQPSRCFVVTRVPALGSRRDCRSPATCQNRVAALESILEMRPFGLWPATVAFAVRPVATTYIEGVAHHCLEYNFS